MKFLPALCSSTYGDITSTMESFSLIFCTESEDMLVIFYTIFFMLTYLDFSAKYRGNQVLSREVWKMKKSFLYAVLNCFILGISAGLTCFSYLYSGNIILTSVGVGVIVAFSLLLIISNLYGIVKVIHTKPD